MKITTIPVLSLMLAFASLTPAVVTAQEASVFKDFGLVGTDIGSGLAGLVNADMISVKRGQHYDETKDPALRKGTENWEQEQGSFFAIPALVIGIIGAVLFFNRK
jgi:hypothetical protein